MLLGSVQNNTGLRTHSSLYTTVSTSNHLDYTILYNSGYTGLVSSPLYSVCNSLNNAHGNSSE